MTIHRVAMFKVKDTTSTIPAMLSKVQVMSSKANAKPYILSLSAGPTGPDPRPQGYNFVLNTQFASKADMDFYNSECEAHAEFKDGLRPLLEGILVVWWDSKGGVEFSQS